LLCFFLRVGPATGEVMWISISLTLLTLLLRCSLVEIKLFANESALIKMFANLLVGATSSMVSTPLLRSKKRHIAAPRTCKRKPHSVTDYLSGSVVNPDANKDRLVCDRPKDQIEAYAKVAENSHASFDISVSKSFRESNCSLR
jgi:hypothetical protein